MRLAIRVARSLGPVWWASFIVLAGSIALHRI